MIFPFACFASLRFSFSIEFPVNRGQRIFIFSTLLFLCSVAPVVSLYSQAVYLPSSHDVYPFLRRMESRGLLEQYRDAARPLARFDLAKQLKTLAEKVDGMTSLERSTYEYLKGEFYYELSSLAGDEEPSVIRWHLVSTDLPQGILNLDLIGRYTYTSIEKETARLRGQGAKFSGYVYKNVGFYFNFVDFREAGKAINRTKSFTTERGIVPTLNKDDVLEYNTIEAQLTWQVGEFQFSLEKMQNVWGPGRHGTLTFSEKAPSYPQIKMRVPIASWIDFVYLHAELKSNVLDSARSYEAGSSAIINFFRPVERLKYLAAHQVELTPIKGLDISLGESIVYSDRGPQLIYLIPVVLFKAAEHYNSDTDNAQWFFSVDLNLIRNLNLYSSLFIDELNSDAIFNTTQARNQVGYTVGVQTYDLPFNNLELNVEYTRLNPWVYSHKFPAATFTSHGYDLGHWIGQNADNLYFDLNYRPFRSLLLGGTYEIFRKGGKRDVAFQYITPSQPFLYGPLREERSFGFYSRLQFVRDGFLDARFRSFTLSDEAANVSKEKKIEFSIGVSYGVW